MSDLLSIIARAETGDAVAAEALMPIVYDELRQLAASMLSHEKPGQTLQATALVHEAYLRLLGANHRSLTKGADGVTAPTAATYDGRAHFFAAAAQAMRRILVDQARRRTSNKHGGHLTRQEMPESEVAMSAPSEEILAVHDALEALAAADPLTADLVKLHYFAGFSLEEAGEILGMSRATAYRTWTYGRTWLRAELLDGESKV